MVELWARWEPVGGLRPKYFIDSISDNLNGFRVLLSDIHDEKKQVEVTFEESVAAYMSADETYRYKLILDLGEKYGDSFYGQWTFFKVTNSSYVKWISEQSCTISDSRNLMHFSLIAGNCVLDILNGGDPEVKIIQLP